MRVWKGDVGRRLRQVLSGFADLVLPDVCSGCEAELVADDGLCEACNIELLELVAQSCCPRCGADRGPGLRRELAGCEVCPSPLPRFAMTCRVGPYKGVLRRAIRDWKYHRRERLLGRFARLLAEAVRSQCGQYPGIEPPDLLVPVPMYWRRRWTRGYVHADQLARRLGRELALPSESLLVRVRHTPPQVHLSRSERRRNIRGAFQCRHDLSSARVLLVDDVTTTGATADEAARVLREAGASSVTLAVVAKASPPVAYGHRPERF